MKSSANAEKQHASYYIGVTHAQETCTKNLYQKLATMNVTKIMRSAVHKFLEPETCTE